MTKYEMIEFFKEYRYTDLYEFERIENPIGLRPDCYAFKLLNDCVPGRGNIIEEVIDGCIRLSIDCHKLAKTVTEEIILSLVRCGVEYSKSYDRLEIVYEDWKSEDECNECDDDRDDDGEWAWSDLHDGD